MIEKEIDLTGVIKGTHKILPIDPTDEMCRAGGSSKLFGVDECVGFMSARACYNAMIKASPIEGE